MMHGSEPLIVEQVHPMDLHPVLKDMDRRRIRRLAKGGKKKPTKAKVNIEVEVKTGEEAE